MTTAFWSCSKSKEEAPEPTPPAVSVTGVTLDKSSISILVGASETLAATVSPKDAANKKVSWQSDKPEIATVDASGKVTGVAAGEATITVTTEDGGTATLYALPTQSIVTEDGITLTVKYDGKFYTKTFAGKEFKENSNITLAAPSLEGGWAEAVTEYAAADLKMGDYLYSDGTTSDGGLRKLFPQCTRQCLSGIPPGVFPISPGTTVRLGCAIRDGNEVI